jgi:hypothetical protein
VDVEAATYWIGWVRLVQLVAVFLVAIGVAAEFAGEWIGRPLEKIIDDARELHMTQLTNDTARLSAEAESARSAIATANERAAKAEERAAEANLALARLTTRRVQLLTPEAVASFVERIGPFRGTKFDVGHAPNGREQWDFLWQLEPMFSQAGWVLSIG